MPTRLLAVALALCLILPPQAALACLWDYDTLRDEQRGLPTMLAILSGKWERHSDYFYEQRVERMSALLAQEPGNLPAIDNLAVALEKLGRVDEAIVLMQEKLALPDDGEHPHYTTHANLGTFFLHRFGAGGDRADLDRGIDHIRTALEINPDAHFGREKYQLQVAEYIRAAQDDPAVLDRGSFVLSEALGPKRAAEMAEYLAAAEDDTLRLDLYEHYNTYIHVRTATSTEEAERLQPAIDGVVGMIRFGTGKSPHLYYALGDLLAARGDNHLAARAYLRALEFGHPRPEMVREARDRSAGMIKGVDLDDITADFEREKADAAAWVAAYQAFEDDLVRRGVDRSDESVYEPFYAEHGQPRAELGFALSDHLPRGPAGTALIALVILALLLTGFLLTVVFLVKTIRRRRRTRAGAFT